VPSSSTNSSNTDSLYYNTYHHNNYTYYGQGQTAKQRYQPHHHNAHYPNPYFDEEAFYHQQEPQGEFSADGKPTAIQPTQENETRKKLQLIGSRIYRKTNATTSTTTTPSNKAKLQSTQQQSTYGKRSYHTNVSFSSPGSINLARFFNTREDVRQQNVIVEYDDEFERKLAVITGPETFDENNNKWIIIDIHGMNKIVNSSQLTYQFSLDPSDKGFDIEDAKTMQLESDKMIEHLTDEDCDKMWRSFMQRKSVKITIKEASEYLFQSAQPTALYSAYRFLYKNPLYFKHTSNLNFECRSQREVEELKQMGSEERDSILQDKIFLLKITNRLLVTNEERGLFYKQLRNNTMKEIKAMRPDLELTRDLLELDEVKDKERISLFRQYALGMYTNLDGKKKIYEAFFKPLGADDHLQAFRVARDLKLFGTQNIHLLRSMEDEMCHMREREQFEQLVNNSKESILASVDPDSKIRRDLRHMRVYTIDEYPKTNEVDDGVSIEVKDGEYFIYVHIADVTRYLTHGSNIDLEAQKRVSSVYLPEGKFNMIPDALSVEILSLSDQKENYALTFSCKVNSDGSLSDWTVFPSSLSRVKKVDYSDADRIIDQSSPSEYYDDFKAMLHVANMRFRYRMGKGATPPNMSPKPKVYVEDSETNIIVDSTFEEQVGASRRLVQEFMIAANEIGGYYASKNDIAVPYRGTRTITLETPPALPQQDIEQLLSISTKVSEKEMSDIVIQSNNKFYPIAGVCINQSPKFHQGIGCATYVQVTSPIRRYSDLLVHYQIKAQMRGEQQPFTWDQVQDLLFSIEPTTRAITSLQRKSERFWLLKYFEQNLTKLSGKNNRYKALVLETKNNSTTTLDHELPYVSSLYLMDSAFKTSVKSTKNHEQGSFIHVRVSSVSPYNDEISFEEMSV